MSAGVDVSLEGKVAVVTGAGAGLGKAEALGLARGGASVIVNDLAANEALTLVDEVERDPQERGGDRDEDRGDEPAEQHAGDSDGECVDGPGPRPGDPQGGLQLPGGNLRQG